MLGLGRDETTILLTNDPRSQATVIARYAQSLSSAVGLKVDFDFIAAVQRGEILWEVATAAPRRWWHPRYARSVRSHSVRHVRGGRARPGPEGGAV